MEPKGEEPVCPAEVVGSAEPRDIRCEDEPLPLAHIATWSRDIPSTEVSTVTLLSRIQHAIAAESALPGIQWVKAIAFDVPLKGSTRLTLFQKEFPGTGHGEIELIPFTHE